MDIGKLIHVLADGKRPQGVLDRLNEKELAVVYDALWKRKDGPQTIQRAELLRTLIAVNRRLLERLPGKKALATEMAHLQDQLSIARRETPRRNGNNGHAHKKRNGRAPRRR